MRIRVAHETIYRYGRAPSYAIQTLRLTPRGHDGQFVCRWRIDIDAECRLHRDEDPFGNITHTFTVDGPISQLRVFVEGEVETENTAGFVLEGVERLPTAFYLRNTELTEADHDIKHFAAELSASEGGDQLATLHALMQFLHETMRFDTNATSTATTARQAFAAKHGVCQDFAQVFISAARSLGIPSRYVGGYFLRADGEVTQEAGHAWAEACLPGLGWIGFDPANGICVTEQFVRVATALDSLGAAPVRGVRTGGDGETLDVKVVVEPAHHTPRALPKLTQTLPGMWQTIEGGTARQSMLPPG